MGQNLEDMRDEQLLTLLAIGAKAYENAQANGNTDLAVQLVEDDRPLIREMLKRGLTPEGFTEDAQ